MHSPFTLQHKLSTSLYCFSHFFDSPSPALFSCIRCVIWFSLSVCLFVPTHTGTRNISLYLFIYALIKKSCLAFRERLVQRIDREFRSL
jgi:hypothetical protein